MTEEQRKAVIDKAAITLYGLEYFPGYSYEDILREWSGDDQQMRDVYRGDAETALDAVGYFKAMDVVEAAQ